jgi:hypothetical protein
VAFVHGIGATTREAWAHQSVDALSSWWTTVRRDVEAFEVACPENCGLAPGHRHLQLVRGRESSRVDLEPLFWADCVCRPGRWRCASLVLQAGLLIGLVDLLAAGLETFEQLDGGLDSMRATTLTCWRMISLFARALMAPALTMLVAFFVLVIPRVRATVGDAMAWSTDPGSHERVKQEIMRSLERREGSVVLVGHSQGGSIVAELEPRVRRPGREVRLVTLGSGHGLLAAIQKLMPDWTTSRSLLAWGGVLVYATLAIVTIASSLLTMLHPVMPLAAAPLKVGAATWLMHEVPLAQTQSLLTQGTNVISSISGQLTKHFSFLPPISLPVEIAGAFVGLLIAALAVKPARLLHQTVATEAPGIDVVATHDLVAAAMLQVGPANRRRRVSQCGSLLLDHTSYLRNQCVVLPLVAGEVEAAAHLREDETAEAELSMEEYHRSGLALRGWTRPVLVVAVVLVIGGFSAGRVPAIAWISAAVVGSVVACMAVTASSARWLGGAMATAGSDPARAMALEQARRRMASRWWAGSLAVAAIPLIGGAGIMFTTPSVLDAASKHAGLPALTSAAFVVGVALCGLAWLSLFGIERGRWTVRILLLASLAWLLQGTRWGVETAALMLGLTLWAYRRARRHRRQLGSLAEVDLA